MSERAARTSVSTACDDAFGHPALFYRSEEEYCAALVPFLREGLADGEPVLVAVPGPRLDLLRDVLGEPLRSGDEVVMLDMARAGRNPGAILGGVLRAFADCRPDAHVRMVGEPIWATRSAAEYPACVQHEALINTAFADRHVTIVCPYNAAELPADVLGDARGTHPEVWEAGGRSRSDGYAPEEIFARYNQPLSTPADALGRIVTDFSDLSQARRFIAAAARYLGLSADRISELEVIASELATNSLRHTAGGCQLQLWLDERHLVCAVTDTGDFADPLAGRIPASEDQSGGRGLLLVHQLADLVRMHTSPTGTTIHAYLHLDAPAS